MIERKDRTRQLKEMRCPVLFVIGKQDNAVPYRDMLAQSAIPGQSVVHLLGEVGHTGMLEAPKKLNSILNKYCEYLFEGKLP